MSREAMARDSRTTITRPHRVATITGLLYLSLESKSKDLVYDLKSSLIRS